MTTRAPRMTTMAAAAAVALTVTLAGGLAGCARSAKPTSPAWTPTANQHEIGLKAAHDAANASVPANDTSPAPPRTGSTTWPTNVQAVTMIETTRDADSPYFGGDIGQAGDDRDVLIVQLVGAFSGNISSPAGAKPFATGRYLTVAVDAQTGDVLDSGIEAVGRALPDPVVLYSRGDPPGVPVEFVRACGHPDAAVYVIVTPITVRHRDCDLTGVTVHYGLASVGVPAKDSASVVVDTFAATVVPTMVTVTVAAGTHDVTVN